MNNAAIFGIAKAMMMKEALASCQMEGIGLDLTLEDMYLQELKDSSKSRNRHKTSSIPPKQDKKCDSIPLQQDTSLKSRKVSHE